MKVSPASAPASKPKRRRCKNCPQFFAPRQKGGSPQEFCSDACRKEFHRNGAAFGALRDKLPGYIDKAVQKHLGRPTEEQYQALLIRIGGIELDMAAAANTIAGEIGRAGQTFDQMGRRIEQIATDLNAHKQGL